MLEPVIRAALLDGSAYQDIGEKPEHLFRAIGLVLAAAIGFWIGISFQPAEGSENTRAALALISISSMMVGWVAWSVAAYVIGTRLFGGKASYRLLLRALGLAYGPAVFLVLLVLPKIGPFMLGIILLWMLAAGTVAVRETQGTGWAAAFTSSVVGWVVVYWLLAAT